MSNGVIASSDGTQKCKLFDDNTVYFSPDYLQTIVNTNSDVKYLLVVDDNQLLEKLCTLNIYKGAGFNDIPPSFIVNYASNILQPLKRIFSLSIASGVFPRHLETC